MTQTPKFRLDSPSHSWVREISGNTKQEFALAVAKRAGVIPDNAHVIDENGKDIGGWLVKGRRHAWASPALNDLIAGRPGLFFSDNRPGNEYLWITDQSEAVCLRP